ncbi:hypothetical protein RLIN73S_07145 [Rhodanobacter lindaniclasticus]
MRTGRITRPAISTRRSPRPGRRRRGVAALAQRAAVRHARQGGAEPLRGAAGQRPLSISACQRPETEPVDHPRRRVQRLARRSRVHRLRRRPHRRHAALMQSATSPRPRRLLSSGAAWMIPRHPCTTRPTSRAARWPARSTATPRWHGRPAPATATANAWSIGITDRWTIGVWIGRPDGTPSPGQYGAGGRRCRCCSRSSTCCARGGHARVQPATSVEVCWPLGGAAAPPTPRCAASVAALVLRKKTTPCRVWPTSARGHPACSPLRVDEKAPRRFRAPSSWRAGPRWPRRGSAWTTAPARRCRRSGALRARFTGSCHADPHRRPDQWRHPAPRARPAAAAVTLRALGAHRPVAAQRSPARPKRRRRDDRDHPAPGRQLRAAGLARDGAFATVRVHAQP